MKKLVALLLSVILVLASAGVMASPYTNYSPWGFADPQAVMFERVISSADMGLETPLKRPGDLFVMRDIIRNGKPSTMILVSDTENNRVVVLDENFKKTHIIKDVQFTAEAPLITEIQLQRAILSNTILRLMVIGNEAYGTYRPDDKQKLKDAEAITDLYSNHDFKCVFTDWKVFKTELDKKIKAASDAGMSPNKTDILISGQTLSSPHGLFMRKIGNDYILYVADTPNRRIVTYKYDPQTDQFICGKIYGEPNGMAGNINKKTDTPATAGGEATPAPEGEEAEAMAKNSVNMSQNAVAMLEPQSTEEASPEPTEGEPTEPTESEAPQGGGKENSSDYTYKPGKLTVDDAGRLYIIALDTVDGIIEVSPEGTFSKFVGSNRVPATFKAFIEKLFQTKESVKVGVQQIPTEYNNICIDKEGYIYGTISALDKEVIGAYIKAGEQATDVGAPIRRLAPNGEDILRRLSDVPPVGDRLWGEITSGSQPSALIDVCVLDNGLYSVLDGTRNRVFTYDQDGNLMFVFGSNGWIDGTTQRPVAVDVIGENEFLVLDTDLGQIVAYKPTEFGNMLMEVNTLMRDREYDKAELLWDKLLTMTANSDMVYRGIGKIHYLKGDYKVAMDYFKDGYDKINYSKAFYYYRQQVSENIIPIVMLAIGLLVIYSGARSVVIKVNKIRRGEIEK